MQASDLKTTTDHIDPDEPCYGVLDVDMVLPTFKGQHRYRLTYVIRNDKPVPYVQDLNEMGRYSVLNAHPMLQLFTILEHTVGEAWDICDDVYASGSARDKLRALEERSKDKESIVAEFYRRQDMANEYLRRNPVTAARQHLERAK